MPPKEEINTAINPLNIGLKESYVGKTKAKAVTRRLFAFKSHNFEYYEPGVSILYHDEYNGDQFGAGQENARIKNKEYTRVYGGGVIDQSILNPLNITQEDVINFLKKAINENISKTRLNKTVFYKQDDWQYYYKIICQKDNFPVHIGQETIKYKDHLVFLYGVIFCPVK